MNSIVGKRGDIVARYSIDIIWSHQILKVLMDVQSSLCGKCDRKSCAIPCYMAHNIIIRLMWGRLNYLAIFN